MNSSRTITKARIVERLMLEDILPEEYELTARQAMDIREACGSDVYDMISKAFCFGFYQAVCFSLRDLQEEVHKDE